MVLSNLLRSKPRTSEMVETDEFTPPTKQNDISHKHETPIEEIISLNINKNHSQAPTYALDLIPGDMFPPEISLVANSSIISKTLHHLVSLCKGTQHQRTENIQERKISAFGVDGGMEKQWRDK
jgi:hypothetical protein